MTTITSAKNIVARSVFLLSAVLGGWTASAILSAPITAVEHAMMRGCVDNECNPMYIRITDPDGNTVIFESDQEVCGYGEDSGMKCSMDQDNACQESKCCKWWQIFGCSG